MEYPFVYAPGLSSNHLAYILQIRCLHLHIGGIVEYCASQNATLGPLNSTFLILLLKPRYGLLLVYIKTLTVHNRLHRFYFLRKNTGRTNIKGVCSSREKATLSLNISSLCYFQSTLNLTSSKMILYCNLIFSTILGFVINELGKRQLLGNTSINTVPLSGFLYCLYALRKFQ